MIQALSHYQIQFSDDVLCGASIICKPATTRKMWFHIWLNPLSTTSYKYTCLCETVRSGTTVWLAAL